MEYHYCMKNGVQLALSTQEIVDCTADSFGCNGGWYGSALRYIQNKGGIAAARDYPYTSTVSLLAYGGQRDARNHAHTHTGTRAHAHTRTRAHAHTRTRAHAHTRTRAHAHTRTRAHAHTRTRAHAHTRTRAHAHTRTRAHAHTRTRAHAHTRTRAHAHTRCWR